MKHDKLPQEVASRIPVPAAIFDSMPEVAQQALVQLAQASIQANTRADESDRLRQEETTKLLEMGERLRKQEADDLRRRTGLTRPLDSIGTSRSLIDIQTTQEWKEVQMSLEDSFNAHLISREDYVSQLRGAESDLMRHQEAKYRRELHTRTVKSINTVTEHIKSLTRHGYMATTIDPELLYDEDRFFISADLMIPSRLVLETQIVRMLADLRTRAARDTSLPPLRENHTVTVEANLFFVAANRHPSYTRNQVITHPDGSFKEDWFGTFVQEAQDKYDVFTNADIYEELEELCLKPNATLHVILTQFDSIEEWFDDVSPDEKTRNMHDFRLLLCSDRDRPCEQQAVEHFGRIWDSSKTVRQNLEEPCSLLVNPSRLKKDGSYHKHTHTKPCFITRKVVLYTPLHRNIRQIQRLEELTRKDVEIVETTDCSNTARLLTHKGHVGVITRIFVSKMSKKGRNRKVIVRTPIAAPAPKNSDMLEIFLDFETFRRRSAVDNTPDSAVPFLVCWAIAGSEKVECVHSENVVVDFVDTLLETYESREIVLWAWNGSGFDHHLLTGELKRRNPDEEDIKQRSNRILEATFRFGSTCVILKDPMLFIPTSLASAARDFGVLSKGDFPHDVVSDRSCLTQVIEDWFMLKSKIVESVASDCGKIMLVEAVSYHEIVESGNKLTVLEKAIEYCKIDVLSMMQIWTKFKQNLTSSLGIDVPITIITLPQLAFSVLVSKLPKGVELHVPERRDYEFIRSGLFGGRVMAKPGVYNERCIYVDVVSEYPSVMWLYDQPYGRHYETTTINWDKLGIYEVSLVFKPCASHPYSEECHECALAKNQYTEFLPRRAQDERLEHSWLLEQKGVWSTYDLEIALDDGYVIQEVSRGLEWPYKGKIFAPFIETVRHIKENAPTASERTIGKNFMNSSYGKTYQKPIDEETFIVPRGTAFQFLEDLKTVDGTVEIAGVTMEMPVFHELDESWEKMTLKIPGGGENRYPSQNGAFILSGARKFLRDHLLQIRRFAPNVRVVYSDTDSLIIVESSLDVNLGDIVDGVPSLTSYRYDPSSHFGTKLGQLDDTVLKGFSGIRLDRVVIAAKKMYGYSYTRPDSGQSVSETHMKGVPNKMLSMEQMDFLLQDTDRHIRYAMMLMKKNLVSVQMMDIVKEIGMIKNKKAVQRCIDGKCTCTL